MSEYYYLGLESGHGEDFKSLTSEEEARYQIIEDNKDILLKALELLLKKDYKNIPARSRAIKGMRDVLTKRIFDKNSDLFLEALQKMKLFAPQIRTEDELGLKREDIEKLEDVFKTLSGK